MRFSEAYRVYRPEIVRLSHSPSQYIPEMDPEDVASEMMIVLWKAIETFDSPKVTFGAYWWAIWTNRRKDLLASYYAEKRVHAVPVEVLPDHAAPSVGAVMFPVPKGMDEVLTKVWTSLASGDTPIEIRTDTGISRRRYYAIVSEWRTESVRSLLSDEENRASD